MASKISYSDALKGTSTSSTQSCPEASPTLEQSLSMASPTPGPSSSMASSESRQSPSVPKSERADCMFHSPEWKHFFQYVFNKLYDKKLIAGPKKDGFFKRICFCDGKFDFNSLFKNRAEAIDYVHFSKTEINQWKNAPLTHKKLFKHFAEFENGNKISGGFLKFLYYFKKSYDGEFNVS